MSRRVVVSDLHIDTWTDRKIRGTGKTKQDHFFGFLDRCEQAKIDEFIINGDIMDFPSGGGEAFPDDKPIVRAVLGRLVELSTRIPVTYVFGNHDIGISGFQTRNRVMPALGKIAFWYPTYELNPFPNTTILVNHGHQCDPCLALYVKSLMQNTYLSSEFSTALLGMQRKSPGSSAAAPVVGVADIQAVTVPSQSNAYQAVLQNQAAMPSDAEKMSLWDKVKLGAGAAMAPLTREWFWRSAFDEMKEFIDAKGAGNVAPSLYMVFGHTHAADARTQSPQDYQGVQCRYLNSGTWTEGDAPGPEIADQGWYVDINDVDGEGVWLQDWISETEQDKRLFE